MNRPFRRNIENGGFAEVKIKIVLDFRLSPCFECLILSFGLFPGVCSLNANVSEHSVCSIFVPTKYRIAYEDETERVFRNVDI
jgi:hypothetical protein